jgi:hypothetical protein
MKTLFWDLKDNERGTYLDQAAKLIQAARLLRSLQKLYMD